MVEIDWADDAQTTVVMTVHPVWDHQEGLDAMSKLRTMVMEVEHPYIVIVDLTATDGDPKNALTYFPQYARRLPPPERRAALTIVAAPNTFLAQLMFTTFSHVYGGRFEVVRSMDDAWAYVDAHPEHAS